MQADRACEKRMAELAARAARTGVPQVAWFLSPAEQAQAEICARGAGVSFFSDGGTADAERRVVAFADADWQSAWPIRCLQARWHAKYGRLGHRDLLGALMALGIGREKLGDIYMGDGQAHFFVLQSMADYIAANLSLAGSVPIHVAILDQIPALMSADGETVRATVASLRLDAVLGAVWRLSRGRAAELVASGRVQVDHRQELRPDRQLDVGMAISVRGLGRAKLDEIGGRTKKDRISVTLLRY